MATAFPVFLKKLGKNIKAAREKRGLRQTDVQDKIGLTYRHYQSIEAGRVNPTVETLFRLAGLYRVKVKDLL
jgi:transcriptional regulator with XRE-family HTH domain